MTVLDRMGNGFGSDEEAARQRSLDRLQLTDSETEERFDQITRLAQRVFDVPIATVTLLDKDRLWFKSVQGLDITEAPRRDTFCQVTVQQVEGERADPTVLVEDAREDERFAQLPVVQAADGIRFYAGYPLFGPGGHAVGTFCLFDTEPRTLDKPQLQAFCEMADWAQREMLRADDMNRAAQVQQRLLPVTPPRLTGYEVDAVCQPAFLIGGDFYDMYKVPGGMMFTVADVMGKGTGAAIITASVRAVLRGVHRTVASSGFGTLDLSASMDLAGSLLHEDLEHTSSFVTAFHARLEAATGDVEYVDAGHGLALICRGNGDAEWLSSDGFPLGVVESSSWTARSVHLDLGDSLVCFSDGLLELFGPDDLEAMKMVEELVRANPRTSDVIRAIKIAARVAGSLDDVTAVAVRRLSPADGTIA
ncbi:PP2C family protein-serine/threonine phosphatase [Actinomycetes bacterium M1A6_2h]